MSLRRAAPLLAVIALVLLAALPVLTYPLGRDQGEFATIGRGLLQGKAPYTELWNPKPPAVFVVYAAALALFGQDAPAIRAIDLLIAPALLGCSWWLGRRLASEPRRSQRAGLLAALFLGVFYFGETFWTLSQNDGIALVPMLLAMVCALAAAERVRAGRPVTWQALACGALFGVVVWFKYPFALFGLALAALALLTARRIPGRAALAFALGVLLTLAAGAGLLAAAGALPAMLESARVTSAYTALGLNWVDFSTALGVALGYRWAHWGALFTLAALGLLVVWIHRRRLRADSPAPKRQANQAGWGVIVWLLAATAIMVLQAKAYDYHWLPMLPPLALLGAAGADGLLAALGDRFGRRREAALSLALGAALLAALALSVWGRAWPLMSGQEDLPTYADRFVAGEFVAGESLRAADYLKARVLPGDSLYIWGFRPEIYFLSRLNPPTRFIFQFPLTAPWYPADWREENVELLWAALPPYVLVAQIDYMPWVTGSEQDSATLLQEYEELNDWLIYNYQRETQIGNLFVWRRKT